MIEDLRNYRGLGGSEQNPDATMISPRAGSLMPAASTSPGLRGLHGDPSASPVLRSLQSHGGNPSQTPVIRRTGYPGVRGTKEEQPSWQHLCGVAAAERDCVWRLQAPPEFQATRERNKTTEALKSEQPTPPAAPSAIQPSTISIPVAEQPASATAPGTAQTNAPAQPADTARS